MASGRGEFVAWRPPEPPCGLAVGASAWASCTEASWPPKASSPRGADLASPASEDASAKAFAAAAGVGPFLAAAGEGMPTTPHADEGMLNVGVPPADSADSACLPMASRLTTRSTPGVFSARLMAAASCF